MLSLVSFIFMLSVLLDRYMIILCLAPLVNFPAQANPVLSASGSGSGLCVAARPVLCCAVFRSMGSGLSTGRILVQDRRSVSRSVCLSVCQSSQLDRSELGSAGVAEAGRTGSDGSMQSRARPGPGQELIAAERQRLRGREDGWLPTNTPARSGSEAVATMPAELGHRLQPSLVGVGSCAADHAGGPLSVLGRGSLRGCLLSLSLSKVDPVVLAD